MSPVPARTDTGGPRNWSRSARPVSGACRVCPCEPENPGDQHHRTSAVRGRSVKYQEDGMTIEGRAVLVTGANRGIGQALVEKALRRGAKRVYAGTRQALAHPDRRVTPIRVGQ